MAVVSVPAGTVMLTAEDVPALVYALETAQRSRARNGLGPHPRLSRALAALTAATVAAPGHSDRPEPAPGDDDVVTLRDAARLMRCSERTARRRAPLLGGHKIGGNWLLDRAAVEDHCEGAQSARRNTR